MPCKEKITYVAEEMPLYQIAEGVCSRYTAMCRKCECLDKCAIGRRYLREVEAGNLSAPDSPRIDWKAGHTKAEIDAIRFEKIIQIKNGLEKGIAKKHLAESLGYLNYYDMMKMYRRHCQGAAVGV